ncbi:MAG: hypothetical protein II744_00125 [Eubacterium sp.]|nr:hypothetical protein [Eubacterium sp.]
MSEKVKEVKLRKDGLPKQPLTVFEKIVIVISILLIIATALCGTVKWGFVQLEGVKDIVTSSLLKKDEEKPKLNKNIMKYANYIMPDSIELENGEGIKFDVRLEMNTGFNPDEAKNIMDYLNIFRVFDKDGNELQNDDSLTVGKSAINGSQLKIMALIKLADKLAKVKEIINNILIALILLDIIAGVFIAYFIWRRADDRRELRELQVREQEIKRVTGISEEEARAPKKYNRKKKKKK